MTTSSMSPVQRYERDLAAGILQADPAQAEALLHFQRVYDELLAVPTRESRASLWQKLAGALGGGDRKPPTLSAIYLSGGVGRGETSPMGVFNEGVPFPDKMRPHPRRFRRRVTAELASLKVQSDPLAKVAGRLAGEARVISFAAFFVSDIG